MIGVIKDQLKLSTPIHILNASSGVNCVPLHYFYLNIFITGNKVKFSLQDIFTTYVQYVKN